MTLTVRQKQEVKLIGGLKASLRKFGQTDRPSKTVNQVTSICENIGITSAVNNICKTQRDLLKLNSFRTSQESDLEENICVVCYSKESNIVIMQCGHSDICEDCAKDVWRTSELCYICQQEVDYMAKIERFSDDVFEIKYCIHLK